MAAFFNFIAFTIFPLKVAQQWEKVLSTRMFLIMTVIASALVAAITWNLITWWLGLPSSSSHTLVGGLVGAAVAHAGFSIVIFAGVIKIVAFIFIAPILGMVIVFHYFLICGIVYSRKLTPSGVDKIFRRLQIVSASAFSLGHGGNDAQKSMGIIWAGIDCIGIGHKE